MAARYDVGDRVTIKKPHAKGHAAATIKLVSSETPYGVVVDGMESMGVHKWYVGTEIEPLKEDDKGEKKKKTEPMKMRMNSSSYQQVRVNIRSTVVNAATIRKEKRNGRDVIIVPSATLPDDVVMNGILYPADEIEKSFKGLERTPAPLGHPEINGKFVSASDPEGINQGWIGAWNENVRRENGRVFLDKVIDVERANESDGGRRVLDAIEKGKPVHTSTGLYALMEAANGDVDYKYVARDIVWDHDAILLDEQGAATPEQGVGMLVNKKGEHVKVEVINSSLDDAFDHEIDWAGTRLVEAVRRKADASKWQELKTRILEALGLTNSERSPSINQKEDDMAVSDEQFKALSDEVKTLSESLKPDALAQAIGNAVAAAVKPLTDANEAILANQKAKDEAELEGLRKTIVEANLLDEDGAKELTLNAARKLAERAKPGSAAPLNPAFRGNADNKPGFKVPAAKTGA